MRVSVIQMQPGHDKAANIEQAGALIDAAVAADRPDLVSLPEVWSCLGGARANKFDQAELLPDATTDSAAGSARAFLADIARRHAIVVHGGSIGERIEEGPRDGRLANTCLIFDAAGHEIARYRKIHMFDITTPEGQAYHESATYQAGERIVTVPVGDHVLGLTICYDIRFAELYLALRRAGADIVMVPSAFTQRTGMDHWEVLIRARAIETQTWMVAAATTGPHDDGRGGQRQTYGHSMVVDPWGHVVARASDGPGFVTATIDPALTARVRRDMPILEHRRLA